MATYTYIDADQNTIGKSDDGITTFFFHPNVGDPLYDEMVAAGITPQPYVAPVITVTPSPLEARLAALEANEISDDATDSALLTLIAGLATRISALEGGN